MSKDDIERAVKEAEQYAAEDAKIKEKVEVRNQADQMVYQAEKTLSEVGDKVPESEKAPIQAGIDKLKETLKGEDTDAIKAATEELTQAFYKMSEKLYQQQAPQGDAAAQQPGGDTGAQGGHPDTAQGAKCTIVIAPLLQGRIPAICTDVTTVTTPGESVDIVVTDYGVAVNPRRPDLLEALKAADCVPLKTIEELRDIAYSIVGEPEKVQFGDRIVGIIEARDGTVMDVVREVKPFSFRED